MFCDSDGRYGNPLGVVLDGAAVPDGRQEVAARLGFSETVFVDEDGAVDIYTPWARMPFAGHPLVGTAWLLRRHDVPIEQLRPPAGAVSIWESDGLSWIRARADWAHDVGAEQYPSAYDIETMTDPPPGEGWFYPWAWQDESAGRVRSRGFPSRGEVVVEDEATGVAAIALSTRLGRELTIAQGNGSVIVVRPHPDGTVDLGGHVVHDETRPL